MNNLITVSVEIDKDLSLVWEYFTNQKHVINWYFASSDWHSPYAENDLQLGGKFKTRMEAKDQSFGFDFEGTYTKIDKYKQIDCILADNRTLSIIFNEENNRTVVSETFEPESENSIELQQAGWQSILNNFKLYTELN